MEVFECLHKQMDVFLNNFVNAIWSLKRPKGPPLFILVTFLCKFFSLTLQRLQASSILNRVLPIGLATSQLPPPISVTDLLQVPSFLYGKIWVTYYKWSIFDMDRF
jgi:hypothetical protein